MNDSCLIANPAAGRGRAARRLDTVRAQLATRGVTDVRLSQHAGHERELAREAAASGIGTIIALGGDGTWSNVARGILDANADCRLALLAGGTGNDLAFAAGLQADDTPSMIAVALGGETRRVDVGRVDGVSFLNFAGFGFDPHVLEASQRITWLRGHAVYLVTALGKIFTYGGTFASLAIDQGIASSRQAMLAVVIANGSRFGGGFLIAPQASISDGSLDVVTVRDANAVRRAKLFAGATRGSHIHELEVKVQRAQRAIITFDTPPLFDADGDLFQAKSPTVQVEILASRLRLAVPSR